MATSASIVREKPSPRSSSSSLTLLSLPGEIKARIFKFLYAEDFIALTNRGNFQAASLWIVS